MIRNDEFVENYRMFFPPQQFKKYEKNGFCTPSRKVELNSSILRELGYPVVMDATHAVQRPGGLGTGSGGDGRYAPALARAAVATGVDGVFMETHMDPRRAKSDAANAIRFSGLEKLSKVLLKIHADVR